MDFGFNSTIGPVQAGFGSDGASIATPSQAAAVKSSDNGWLSGALGLLNAAAPVAASVIAAKQAKAAAPADPGSYTLKTGAPVVGLQAVPAPVNNTNTYLMIGGGVVALLLVAALVFKKK